MMIDTQQNPLHKAIDFGFEVEAFLQSDIGRYLTAKAEAEVEDATESLKRADPECARTIRELQHKIHVAEDIQYWLAEAVQAGINAQIELHERN